MAHDAALLMPDHCTRFLAAAIFAMTTKSPTTATNSPTGGDPPSAANFTDPSIALDSVNACGSSVPLTAMRVSPNWTNDHLDSSPTA